MLKDSIRKQMGKIFTGKKEIAFSRKIPSPAELINKLREIDKIGIYLHIPFCDQICPYCPYNKELYKPDKAKAYTQAVKQEISVYSDIMGNTPVTSFYIGGGTPTTMIRSGLDDILRCIYDKLNMQCGIHMESHPNHLSKENLRLIDALGAKYLSIGIEALQDRHLKALHRPYRANEAKEAIHRALENGFECVNADVIFALPDQTCTEIKQTCCDLIELGIDQVAAYPLFRFPYTKFNNNKRIGLQTILRRRKMLRIIEDSFYNAGYERSSVWAFTRKGTEKYCSVAIPLYVGLGASGGSYLKDVFYLNTFNINEYIAAMNKNSNAIALSIDLTRKMQMAGWLYWRIYETQFSKSEFSKRFNRDFDEVYSKYMKQLALLGFLKDDGEHIKLTDRGTYWLHAFEDFFSINYIGKLWGTSEMEPWPEKIVL